MRPLVRPGTIRRSALIKRLAIFDEGFVDAGFGLDRTGTSALDAKTAALLQVAVAVAIGSSPVCLQWDPRADSPRPADGLSSQPVPAHRSKTL